MNEKDQSFIKDLKESKIGKLISKIFCMINRKTLIDIIIVIIPILLIWIYFTGTKTPQEVKDALKSNKKIELKVDSLKQDNQFIVERMYELEKKQTLFFDMINQNNSLIKENNRELLRLKRIYHEKINSINDYNVSQLDSFFTKKYKEFYNR